MEWICFILGIAFIIMGLLVFVIQLIGSIIGILLAVFLPTVIAESELDGILTDLKEMNEPVMIVTDMKADNTFSDARGEVKIDDPTSTGMLINEILELSDNFKYDGKDSSDTWDIRVKVNDGEKAVELYFAYGKMYYVKNGAKYVFVPEGAEVKEDFKVLYKTLSAFVQ